MSVHVSMCGCAGEMGVGDVLFLAVRGNLGLTKVFLNQCSFLDSENCRDSGILSITHLQDVDTSSQNTPGYYLERIKSMSPVSY